MLLSEKNLTLWDSIWQVPPIYTKGQGSSDKGTSVDLEQSYQEGSLQQGGPSYFWRIGSERIQKEAQGSVGGVVWEDRKETCLALLQDPCWGTVWTKCGIDYPTFENLEENVYASSSRHQGAIESSWGISWLKQSSIHILMFLHPPFPASFDLFSQLDMIFLLVALFSFSVLFSEFSTSPLVIQEILLLFLIF